MRETSGSTQKVMSYKYNTPQIEMYVAFLTQFVCSVKPLISLSGWSCWR